MTLGRGQPLDGSGGGEGLTAPGAGPCLPAWVSYLSVAVTALWLLGGRFMTRSFPQSKHPCWKFAASKET